MPITSSWGRKKGKKEGRFSPNGTDWDYRPDFPDKKGKAEYSSITCEKKGEENILH